MTTLVLLVTGVAILVSGGRLAARLRRSDDADERARLGASLWSTGGTTALVLSVGLGFLPGGGTLPLRIALLAVALVMVGTSVAGTRALGRRREAELLAAGETAGSLAERIDALEARKAMIRSVPLRYTVPIVGMNVFLLGTLASIFLRFGRWPSASMLAVLAGLVAVTVWIPVGSWMKRSRARALDLEIEALLESAPEDGVDPRPGRVGRGGGER